MKRTALFCLFSAAGILSAVAQTGSVAATPAAQSSVYRDPVFYILVFVALTLLIFITQLAKVLAAIASRYKRGDGSAWDKLRGWILIIASPLLFSGSMTAQTAPEPMAAESSPLLDFFREGLGHPVYNILALTILIELAVVLYYTRMIGLFLNKPAEAPPLRVKKSWSFWDKFNQSVAIEKEAAVLTDHDYDGIRELDNALPPWWKYGFYLTIVWAVIYMVYYHVSEAGPLMEEEYQIELAEGRRAVEEYRARAQNLVDESNVAVLTDDGALAQGGKLFGQYCAVCHAADGGGIVGPNLTDVYWLHGGDIKSLFTVVKYGVQGKGMKSWQQELSPAMMAQVTSYILSMQGTTPAKPKDPEGVRYEPQLSAAPADSLTVAAGNQADTTITAATN